LREVRKICSAMAATMTRIGNIGSGSPWRGYDDVLGSAVQLSVRHPGFPPE
jgi:hypothetical protein